MNTELIEKARKERYLKWKAHQEWKEANTHDCPNCSGTGQGSCDEEQCINCYGKGYVNNEE